MIDNKRILETLVAAANDKRYSLRLMRRELKGFRTFGETRNEICRDEEEAFGLIKEANMGTGIKLKKTNPDDTAKSTPRSRRASIH